MNETNRGIESINNQLSSSTPRLDSYTYTEWAKLSDTTLHFCL